MNLYYQEKLIATTASLYYVKNLNQKQISNMLHISQATISRLLDKVIKNKIVKFSVKNISDSLLTYGRISTDDNLGITKVYFGEGKLTDDPLNTFGTRAVAEIPRLQKLMHHVCNNSFEHHVVMNVSSTAEILKEAFSNYLGWKIYHHG